MKQNDHIDNIRRALLAHPGFTQDRRGNVVGTKPHPHLPGEVRKIRFRFKPLVLRREVRTGTDRWIGVWSAYYRDVEVVGNQLKIHTTLHPGI